MKTSPIESAGGEAGPGRSAASFISVFGRWRAKRGLTKKRLAAQMGFDPSYLSHVERGRHRPTAVFARRAELVLRAGGAIWRAYEEYEEARGSQGRGGGEAVVEHVPPPGAGLVAEQEVAGLVVEQEVASLSYRGDGHYRCVVRRVIHNTGSEPVTRWLAVVVVDRYPADAQRSNVHHRAHPLSLEELGLYAVCGTDASREPMWWRLKNDRDARKEIWLLFENESGQFPLYPGERTTIEYGYTVPDDLWGNWFQRTVRFPTGRLVVRLDFPSRLDPQVWGLETSLSTGETPLRTPVVRQADPERAVFVWETEAPPVQRRYTLQWRFRPVEESHR